MPVCGTDSLVLIYSAALVFSLGLSKLYVCQLYINLAGLICYLIWEYQSNASYAYKGLFIDENFNIVSKDSEQHIDQAADIQCPEYKFV